MSLDVRKLEKVRELANGVTQARCPACAEAGGDRKGEHLRIYPDGRYGCCVHPKDSQHRKRIFALAGLLRTGTGERRQFTVKIAAMIKTAEPARSVREALSCGQQLAGVARTLRTGNSGSVSPEERAGGEFRTLRTPVFNPRTCARGESDNRNISRDCENGVLSVLEPEAEPVSSAGRRLPFFTSGGTLSIPFDSPERYHWWKGDGQRLTVKAIRAEVLERKENDASNY